MNILLVGASGFVGSQLCDELIKAGHSVRRVSRSNGVDLNRMTQESEWMPYLQGVQAVVNCAGIITETGAQSFRAVHADAPCALFRACELLGVRRVVQLSALGADDTAFSAFHLSKQKADDTLRGLDLDWFVIRPSLIYGQGGTSAGLLLRLARWPRLFVVGAGEQRIQPVHISDVVEVLVRCLAHPHVRQTVDVVGPQVFRVLDWLNTLRLAQGLPQAKVVNIPLNLAFKLSPVAALFCPLLARDNLRMLVAGSTACLDGLRAFLGREPKEVTPSLLLGHSRWAEVQS